MHRLFFLASGLIHITSLIYILSSNKWIWYPSLPDRNREWFWSGAVTNESFSITTRGMKDRRLEVRKTSNQSLLVHETTIQDVVERVDISGLEPETSYTYRVGDESSTVRTFASFTQSTLRVGFGSCSTSGITLS